VCGNCLSDEGDKIIFHHIVPVILGGTDNLSNIVPLCDKCHKLIHHQTIEGIGYTHGELVKIGMDAAKASGVPIGRPKTTIDHIPLEFKEKYYPMIKDKITNISQVSRDMHCSRNTIYKYIKIIEEN
jgi:hypothetical protein